MEHKTFLPSLVSKPLIVFLLKINFDGYFILDEYPGEPDLRDIDFIDSTLSINWTPNIDPDFQSYKLFELSGSLPPKPGLLRVAEGTGNAIEAEVWALSFEAFGRFITTIP